MTTTYNQLETAFILSALAYIDKQSDLKKTIEAIFGDQETLIFRPKDSLDDNFAFIVYNPFEERYTLAIRGSIPFKTDQPAWGGFHNWITEDLNIFHHADWTYSDVPHARITRGSMIAFNQLQSLLDEKQTVDTILIKAIEEGHRVVITGHSLGGNMANTFASYFAYRLRQHGLPTHRTFLYSIAAPASGNQAFATDLDYFYPGDQSTHYEVDNDIVPKFPLYAGIKDKLTALYYPSPLATNIPLVDFLHLSTAFKAVADLLFLSYLGETKHAYFQPSNNYFVGASPLSHNYVADTVEDYFAQAIYHHKLTAYVNAFHLPKLPPVIDRIKATATAYKAVL